MRDFDSIKRGLNEAIDWADGTGNRSMKHHVTINGKRYTIEASNKTEFKEKLRKLEEHLDDDGA